MTIKVGDTIGEIVYFLSGPLGENYYKLAEGKVRSITINSKGRRVKVPGFYTLDADEIESNTEWMLGTYGIIVVLEPFILTDDLRRRVEAWIKVENAEEGRR